MATKKVQRSPVPSRAGGSKTWAPQHLRAAQIRARGQDWSTVADELGYSLDTVYRYTGLDGWADLVEHYRQELFSEEVRQHFLAGSLEALEALRKEWRVVARRRQSLESQLADPELEPKTRAKLEGQLHRSEMNAIVAAEKYLRAIGFQKYRERAAELDAEVETTGRAGTTHHIEADADVLRGLLGLDSED